MERFDDDRVSARCVRCGHDVASIPTAHLAPALVEGARCWQEFVGTVLDHPGGGVDLCTRPDETTWSAIEYACHVRDVLSLCGRRLELILLSEAPEFDRWDPEAAVDDNSYCHQDGLGVAADISAAATDLACLVRRLNPTMCARTGTRLGRPITAESLVRVALHEILHHLVDARRVVVVPIS